MISLKIIRYGRDIALCVPACMRLKVEYCESEYTQTKADFCLFQLKQLGHSIDKVEFIVMGGTFMCLPEDYRDYFIRNLHDALSGHTSNNVDEAVK